MSEQSIYASEHKYSLIIYSGGWTMSQRIEQHWAKYTAWIIRPTVGSLIKRVQENKVGKMVNYPSLQFSSVTQSYLTFCDPMNHSTPGLPVHHHLPELTQTHVHQVHDAIQPSQPLSSPSPPAPNPSQHQSLFPMSQLFT